jgi:hypothetical protein
MHKISLQKKDLETMMANLSNDWVNLNLCQRKQPNDNGTTHYLVVDKWKPDPSRQRPQENLKSGVKTMTDDEFNNIGEDDLPFSTP